MLKNRVNHKQKHSKRHFKGRSQDGTSNRNVLLSKNAKQYQHQNQLQEVDVGITKFINKLDGFSAVIKARYSDFQVNEVNLEGEVAKLTDLSIPKDFGKKNEIDNSNNINTTPTDKIPQVKWDAIKVMLESNDKNPVELDATNLTKEDRTLIHESIKKAFGNKIYSSTITNDAGKFMVFKKHDGKLQDNRFQWPKDKGEYVHFLVYKECTDTLEACLKIASVLNISATNLTYAGVKDKRAKTTQWFSIRKMEPWKLIVKTRCLSKLKIGNITFKSKPIKLGHLQGNKFRIALRNVMGSDDLIEESMNTLKLNGFINYYGLQRFGNDKEVPTFSIGHQLLLGNWKEACDIILKPTESDDPDLDVTRAKKCFYESRDAAKALEQFDGNKKSCIEYLLLCGLKNEHSNDYVNALANIPRNTRLLYIHSFQSMVWNLVASERIEKFGLQLVEGDLILLSGCDEEFDNEDAADSDTSPVKKNTQVKMLTSDECSDYSIYDIVLPLPGYDIVYPENLKEFYKATLEKYGLSLEMAKQKVQTYNLSGTYRKLLGQVTDLQWNIMHYNDPSCNLIRSDLEELRGHEEPQSVVDGKYKALVLKFFLNSSSYATMVLREILKTDTGSSFHAKLNDYHITGQVENTTREVSSLEKTDDFSEKTGLLADTEKYEEFKNAVFGESNELKRKLEEDASSLENNKKSFKIAS